MKPVSLIACLLLAAASASAQEKAKPADDKIVELGVEGAPDYNSVVTANNNVVLLMYLGSQPENAGQYEGVMKKLKKDYKGDVVFAKIEFAKAKAMKISGGKETLASRLNVYEMAAMPHVTLIRNRGAVHNYDPGNAILVNGKKLGKEKQMAAYINTCLGPSTKVHAEVPPVQCSPTGM